MGRRFYLNSFRFATDIAVFSADGSELEQAIDDLNKEIRVKNE